MGVSNIKKIIGTAPKNEVQAVPTEPKTVNDLLKQEEIPFKTVKLPDSKAKYCNAFVIRHINGRYMGHFEDVHNLVGTPYCYHGHWINLYTSVKTDEGELLKPLSTSEEIKKLPDALWRALHWDSYKKLITPKPTLAEKIKLGIALGFFAISAIILFLIVISLG